MAIHKVLIVDDSKTELMFMTDLLQKNGILVRTAENADEAFKRLADEKPDLILMDLVMPEMDGVETTRLIMKSTPCAILLVTTSPEHNTGQVFRALGAGALDGPRRVGRWRWPSCCEYGRRPTTAPW